MRGAISSRSVAREPLRATSSFPSHAQAVAAHAVRDGTLRVEAFVSHSTPPSPRAAEA